MELVSSMREGTLIDEEGMIILAYIANLIILSSNYVDLGATNYGIFFMKDKGYTKIMMQGYFPNAFLKLNGQISFECDVCEIIYESHLNIMILE